MECLPAMRVERRRRNCVAAFAVVLAATFAACAESAAMSHISFTEKEWGLTVPGYSFPLIPQLTTTYHLNSTCSGADESKISLQGAYLGMLLATPSMGDKLTADIFPHLLGDTLEYLLKVPVEVSHKYAPRKDAVDNETCSTLGRGQPCEFGVVGGGSMLLLAEAAVATPRLSWYMFATGLESGSASNDWHLHLDRLPANMMGGVRGPVTQMALHHYRRHLPVLGDAGLLAGRYFLPGYLPDSLLGAEPSSPVLLWDGTRTIPAPEGRRMLVVSLKNNASSVEWEGEEIDWNSPYMQLYVSLLTDFAKQYQVVLQPVDSAALSWHKQVQQHMNAALPEGADPVLLHAHFGDYTSMLRLCAAADVSLHSRLHAGVMCTAVGTPAVFLSSNVKFSDYLSSLGLGHMRVGTPVDPTFNVEELAGRVRSAVEQAQAQRSSIMEHLRDQQQRSWELHVRSLAAWMTARGGLGSSLARLACCRGGVRVAQGTTWKQHVMNLRLSCRRAVSAAAAAILAQQPPASPAAPAQPPPGRAVRAGARLAAAAAAKLTKLRK